MVRLEAALPADLRSRLETARLDTLALLRALDSPSLPPRTIPADPLHRLFELDADCAEALWALDQPLHSLNPNAMIADTLASLKSLPRARDRVRSTLPRDLRAQLTQLETNIRSTLDPAEAYNQIPGRDPQAR